MTKYANLFQLAVHQNPFGARELRPGQLGELTVLPKPISSIFSRRRKGREEMERGRDRRREKKRKGEKRR